MRINAITPNTINRRYNTIPFKADSAFDSEYYRPNQDVTQFNQNLKMALEPESDSFGRIVYKAIRKISNIFGGHRLEHSEPKSMTDREFSDLLYFNANRL